MKKYLLFLFSLLLYSMGSPGQVPELWGMTTYAAQVMAAQFSK